MAIAVRDRRLLERIASQDRARAAARVGRPMPATRPMPAARSSVSVGRPSQPIQRRPSWSTPVDRRQRSSAPTNAGAGNSALTAALLAATSRNRDDGGSDNIWGRGLGVVLNNPISRTLLQPLETLDYGRRAVTLGFEELAELLAGEEFESKTNEDGTRSEFGEMSNLEKLRDPTYGTGDLLADITGNKWLDRIIGLTGDVAFDPITYLTAGIGTAVKGATTGLSRAGRTGRIADAVNDLRRSGNLTDDAVRELMDVGNRGINVATDRTLPALGMERQGLRIATPTGRSISGPIPGTGGIARGVNQVTGGVRGRLNRSDRVQDFLRARTPKELERATRTMTSGKASPDEFLAAADAVTLNRKFRRYSGGFAELGAKQVDAAMDRVQQELSSGQYADLDAYLRATENPEGPRTALNELSDDLRRIAYDNFGVELPEITDIDYLPHMLSSEFKALLSENSDAAVKFKEQAGLRTVDTLRDSGFLSARKLRPAADGTPKEIDLPGRKKILIEEGTISEINQKVKELFPELKTTALETDPQALFERYVAGVSRDVGLRAARNELADTAMDSIRRIDPAMLDEEIVQLARTPEGRSTPDPFADDDVFRGSRVEDRTQELNEAVVGGFTNRLDENAPFADEIRGEVAQEAGRARDEMVRDLVLRRRDINAEIRVLDNQITEGTEAIADVNRAKRRARDQAKRALRRVTTEADEITKEIRSIRRRTRRMQAQQARDVVNRLNVRMNRLRNEAESINALLSGEGSQAAREALQALATERENMFRAVGRTMQVADETMPTQRAAQLPDDEALRTVGQSIEDTREALPPEARRGNVGAAPEPEPASVELPMKAQEIRPERRAQLEYEARINTAKKKLDRVRRAQRALDRNLEALKNPFRTVKGGHVFDAPTGETYTMKRVGRGLYEVDGPGMEAPKRYKGFAQAKLAAEEEWIDYRLALKRSDPKRYEVATPLAQRRANAEARTPELRKELREAIGYDAEAKTPGLRKELREAKAAAKNAEQDLAEAQAGLQRLTRRAPEQQAPEPQTPPKAASSGTRAPDDITDEDFRNLRDILAEEMGDIVDDTDRASLDALDGILNLSNSDTIIYAQQVWDLLPEQGKRRVDEWTGLRKYFDEVRGELPPGAPSRSAAQELGDAGAARSAPNLRTWERPLETVPVATNRAEFDAFLARTGTTIEEWNEMFPPPPRVQSRTRQARTAEDLVNLAQERGMKLRYDGPASEGAAYFASDQVQETLERMRGDLETIERAMAQTRRQVDEDPEVQRLARRAQNRRKNSPEKRAADAALEAARRETLERTNYNDLARSAEQVRARIGAMFSDVYQSELSRSFRRMALNLQGEKFIGDVPGEPWTRGNMAEFIRKKAARIVDSQTASASKRAPGVQRSLRQTEDELLRSMQAGRPDSPPSQAQSAIEELASEAEEQIRPLAARRSQLRQGAREIPAEKKAEIDRLTQEGKSYSDSVSELQSNRRALLEEREKVAEAAAAAPASRRASTRLMASEREVGGVVTTGLRPTNKALDEAGEALSPGLYRMQPLESSLQDIETMARLNPNLDDVALNATEARLHTWRNQLEEATRKDINARQAQQIIDAASESDFVEVIKAKIRDEWVLQPEGDIVMSQQLVNMMQYLDEANKVPGRLGRVVGAYTNFFKTYATLSPGFHVRNAVSATFMNAVDGVDSASQLRGVKLWRQYMKASQEGRGDRWLKNLARTNPNEAAAFDAVFGTGAGGRFFEEGFAESTALRRTRTKEFIYRNWATRKSQQWGERVEGAVRLSMALDSVKRGGTVEQAMDRITRIHFDYSQVSRFDERAKQMIPFWTFMSRNLPMQITQMWTKPKGYAIFNSFTRNFSVEPDDFTPEYLLEQGGMPTDIRTPAGLPGTGEDMQVMFLPDLAHQRVQADLESIANFANASDMGQLASSLNPLLTVPIELGTKTDLFTGRQYSDTDVRPMGGLLDYALLPLVAPFGVQEGPNGLMYEEQAVDAIRSLVPTADRFARIVPGSTATTGDPDRQLESVLRFLGAPVRFVSDRQKRNEQVSQNIDRQDEMAMRRALMGQQR